MHSGIIRGGTTKIASHHGRGAPPPTQLSATRASPLAHFTAWEPRTGRNRTLPLAPVQRHTWRDGMVTGGL